MFKTPSLKPLSKQGDPRKFAQQGISIDGFVPVAELPRLAESLQETTGEIQVDLAFGISYTIDVKQPVGQRITELSFDGQAVADSDLFTVAMNSYRAAGGGDYTAYRDAETIFSGDETIQDMLVSYFKAHNQLPETPKLQLKVIY